VAYGSVVDNGSSDPTYVPASNDSDPPSSSQPTAKVFTVTLQDSHIIISPAPTGLRIGDQVQFKISTAINGLHGFRLTVPDGSQDLVPDRGPYPANQVFTYNFTIPMNGTYFYTCTNSSCSAGHSTMQGTFDVGQASPDPPHY
jgi:heme/copper-type cytochrome/quinol oxidase subunit 2